MELNLINPDSDIDTNIGIALHVINNVSRNRLANLVLTPDKLAAFIFLVSHPTVTNKILKQTDRQTIYLEDTELLKISSKNPSITDMLNTNKTMTLIREMLLRQLITATYANNNIYVDITDNGKSLISKSADWGYHRMDIFAKAIKCFANDSSKSLIDLVLKNI